MVKRVRVVRIADAVTGEIVQESRQVVHISDNFNERGWRWPKARRVSLGSMDLPGLSWAELGQLAALAGAVDTSNRLPAAVDLAGIWRLQRRRVFQLLAKLLQAGAIVKDRHGLYFLNPSVAFAGVYLSPELWQLFRSDLLGTVPKWARDRLDAASTDHGQGEKENGA